MKFSAAMRLNGYTALYHDFSTTTGPDSVNDRTYGVGVPFSFVGGIGMSSNLTIYTKKIPLRQFIRVDNIRDRNGVAVAASEFYPTGMVYEVRSLQPMLSPFGLVEGYRHGLVAVA